MERIIWLRPFQGTGPSKPDYEITVRAKSGTDVPKYVCEDEKGSIQCLTTNRRWDSLGGMTHDLRIEVLRWGSDQGN